MEANKAIIKRGETKASLVLNLNKKDYEIVLTEDNPNNIKSVFNELLKELKKGLFTFELNDNKEDLHHDICKEYLKQLNEEVKIIFNELKEHGLIGKG